MASLINRISSKILSDEKFLGKIRYNENGYYIHSSNKKTDFKVTVIMPVYNAENTIKKTIESVINQTIRFENIELIIVDDKSTDKSSSMLLQYAKAHSNIIPVFLEKNTGSPAEPRNLGIELAHGEYITFIDADDWFHENGLETLYNILKSSGDNYAIGKTIKVDDKGMYIVGEYNSWKNRESIDPLTINRLFHHLGPTARMMNTKFIKENNIKFPNMKFAEDKQFFIDVLIKCKTISTTEEIIYYVNRYKENVSFTTTTTIFEKTDTNISLIKYVINKKLPTDLEKMILNRLFEFDCITRLFNRWHFLKSNKKEKYFEKFSEVLNLAKKLDYDFTENFFEPWHKVLVELFNEKRFDDITTLIYWSRTEVTKDYVVENGLPYYRLPFKDKNKARITMLATRHKVIYEQDKLTLQFKVYGDYINDMNALVIRQRDNDLNELKVPIHIKDENLYEFHIAYEQLKDLPSSSNAIFVTYGDNRKLAIRMNVRKIVNYNQNKLDFYTTISDNFGLVIK